MAVEAQQLAIRAEAEAAAASAAAAVEARRIAADAEAAAGSDADSLGDAKSVTSSSDSGTSDESGGEVQYASELHRQMAMLQVESDLCSFRQCHFGVMSTAGLSSMHLLATNC